MKTIRTVYYGLVFEVNYSICHGFKNLKPVDLVAIQLGDVYILPHLLPILSNPGYVGSFGRKLMHLTELSSLFFALVNKIGMDETRSNMRFPC